jgi:hypothetical protein
MTLPTPAAPRTFLIEADQLAALRAAFASCGTWQLLVRVGPSWSADKQTVKLASASSWLQKGVVGLELGLVFSFPRFQVVPPLDSLDGLPVTHLDLGSRGFPASAVTDISAIAALRGLRSLDLSRTPDLVDLNPIATLRMLRSLTFSHAKTTISLAPIRKLSRLTSLRLTSMADLDDLDAISAPAMLRRLELSLTRATRAATVRATQALVAVTTLTSLQLGLPVRDVDFARTLTGLVSLKLSGCDGLADLRGLTGLPSLGELGVGQSMQLADPERRAPIETLPALHTLTGPFSKGYVARVLARAAASRGDSERIAVRLPEWRAAALAESREPGLLSAVGAAAVLLAPDVAEPVVIELTGRAVLQDVSQVAGLFAAVSALASRPAVSSALREIMAQKKGPLPPETLSALVANGLHHPRLRDATLRALVRHGEACAWSERTSEVLRRQLDGDPRYKVDRDTHELVLEALDSRPADALAPALFGAIASDHALGDPPWRDAFHARLKNLALQQPEPKHRLALLSLLAAGLGQADSDGWSHARLDALLYDAAAITPDTSRLRVAAAHAHARAGRWTEAEDCAFSIAREADRDATLADLAERVLAEPDGPARALSLLGGVSAPALRADRLRSLADRDDVMADPVTSGTLLALLSDAPGALAEVAARAVALHPAWAPSPAPAPLKPMTDRERRLVNTVRRAVLEEVRQSLRQAIDAVRPALPEGLAAALLDALPHSNPDPQASRGASA